MLRVALAVLVDAEYLPLVHCVDRVRSLANGARPRNVPALRSVIFRVEWIERDEENAEQNAVDQQRQ